MKTTICCCKINNRWFLKLKTQAFLRHHAIKQEKILFRCSTHGTCDMKIFLVNLQKEQDISNVKYN